MNAFLLCGILLAVGAVPVLPLFLGKASRSQRAWVRVPAKLLAFLLLLACFVLSAGGLLFGFIFTFGKLGDAVVFGSMAAFTAIGVALSHRIVFRRVKDGTVAEA